MFNAGKINSRSSREFQVKKLTILVCQEVKPTTTNSSNIIVDSNNNNSDTKYDNGHSSCRSSSKLVVGNNNSKNLRRRIIISSRRKRKKSTVVKKQPMSSLAATASASLPASLLPRSSPSSSQGVGERSIGKLIADDKEEDYYLDCPSMNPSAATLSHGLISVIGRRRSMEDAVTVVLSLVDVTTPKPSSFDFFGVYDGHGGYMAAQRCKERLHHMVAEEITADLERTHGITEELDWTRVMGNSFGRMDEEVVAAEGVEDTVVKESAGSTALVVMVGKEVVVVANCGDCRAVLGSGGAALALSRDHKPERPDEKERVEAAGGNVVNWDCSRVLGVLATSRSIGDHYLKPYVIAEPEVTVHKRTDSDEFLIIASDGLWDVVSNEVACELVRKCLNGQVRRKIFGDHQLAGNCAAVSATILAELALARGSRDNISVIVVQLRRPTATSSASSSST